MYVKLFFLAFIVFTVNFTYGQNRYAKFIDRQTGKGIAYCTLTSLSGKNGGFADSLGVLRLDNLNNIDSIKISALGYKEVNGSLNFPDFVKRDTIFFILFQKEIQLEEVKIISSLTKSKNRNEIGYFKKNENLVEITGLIGRTNALFLPNLNKNNKLKISQLLYSIQADQNTKVRLQLFKKSAINNEPSDPLIEENLIVYVKKGQRKIIYDVSKYNIFMPEEGLYISMQWLGEVNSLKATKNVSPMINSHINSNGDLQFFKFLDQQWVPKKRYDKNNNEIVSWAPNFGISVIEYK